jgi:hypothetical protein
LIFTILRALGRDVEMVRYPGESHLLLLAGRPDRRVDRIERMVKWFEEHLGVTPPAGQPVRLDGAGTGPSQGDNSTSVL